jgi:hypothetical protein
VVSDDPGKPNAQLVVVGAVKRFALVDPQHVRLFGAAGAPLKETVRIVPEDGFPFKILETKARFGTDIRYDIKESRQGGTVEYLLTVENLKPDEGRYYDTIFLTTDSLVKPQISIPVYGKLVGTKEKSGTQ